MVGKRCWVRSEVEVASFIIIIIKIRSTQFIDHITMILSRRFNLGKKQFLIRFPLNVKQKKGPPLLVVDGGLGGDVNHSFTNEHLYVAGRLDVLL